MLFQSAKFLFQISYQSEHRHFHPTNCMNKNIELNTIALCIVHEKEINLL